MSSTPEPGQTTGATPPPAAQPNPLGRVTDETRRRSPIVFAIIAICFVLPFVSFSCAGQQYATMSGIDLVRGAKVTVDSKALKELNDSLDQSFGNAGTLDSTSSTEPQSEDTDPELWAIVALAAAVIGIAAGFTRDRLRTLASVVAAAVGVISLAVLHSSLSGDFDIPKEAQALVGFEYRFGYWIVVILFLLLAIAHGLVLRSPPKSLYPQAAPPDTG